MSNTVSQIQASYHPTEDRILLNIKTLNEQIYLAWITRRFLKLLIPVLHGQHPTTGKALFDEKTTHIQQAQREKTHLSGDYETAYVKPENPIYPLGETPILLAKITFKDINKAKGSLALEPDQGQGILLPYHPDILGPLIKIFAKALETAEWDLQLDPILAVPEQTSLQ